MSVTFQGLDRNTEAKLINDIETLFTFPAFSLTAGLYDGTVKEIKIIPVHKYDDIGRTEKLSLNCQVVYQKREVPDTGNPN